MFQLKRTVDSYLKNDEQEERDSDCSNSRIHENRNYSLNCILTSRKNDLKIDSNKTFSITDCFTG